MSSQRYPVRADASRGPHLSRRLGLGLGLGLVKWAMVFPHYVVRLSCDWPS